MKEQMSYPDSPVPPWQHYDIVKRLEFEIHAELEKINYKGYAIGLYAGYVLAPDNQKQDEDPQPFSMCYGYNVNEEVVIIPNDTLGERFDETKNDPLPEEFIDELYQKLEQFLIESAPPDVGIILPRLEITVSGSKSCCGLMCKLCRPGDCIKDGCKGKRRRFRKTCQGWKCTHKSC